MYETEQHRRAAGPIFALVFFRLLTDEVADGNKYHSRPINVRPEFRAKRKRREPRELTAEALRPEDFFWIYNALTSHTEYFELEQTKIFGQPDQSGYSPMTKLRIVRSGVDKNGEVRRYPWCITAENGFGIAQHTRVGGTFCQSGTYRSDRKAFINLSDYDFFRLINRAVRYITQFENTYCPPIIGDGRTAYGNMLMQRQMANNPANNPTQNY